MQKHTISRLLTTLLFTLTFLTGYSQSKTIISGKVTDKETGEAVPFVNVVFYGSEIGTTTDFNGEYSLSAYTPTDSVVFSYIGYETKILPILIDEKQELNVQLESGTFNLNEVVVYSGENPAWNIIRNAVDNKKKHDKRSLESYEYESYTKIELDLDNISEDMKKTKVFREVAKVMDSIAVLKGEEGQRYIPVFISEALSNYYVKNDPLLRKEEVQKTKITGIAIENGSLTSQVIGAFYQEYNFYDNWLTILEKEFVSPIADGWRIYYDYDIMDTVLIGTDSCYQLSVIPKRKEEPAFNGTIWITKDEYALKQIDVLIDKATNLNFIEKIKIQQELSPTDAGPWLPDKTRVLIDVIPPPPSNKLPGFIAKFYNSTRDHEVNQYHPPKFYENNVVVAEDMYEYEHDFWEKNRHDTLSHEEVLVFEMIDTLKSIPIVRTYTDIIKALSTGYWTVGKIDIGPLAYFYANNEVEGHRFVLGARTNEYLSRKFFAKGYLGYGVSDEEFKYSAQLAYILSRRPWTEVGVKTKWDIEQVGLNSEKLADNYIFYTSSKFGSLIEPYYHRQHKLYFSSEILRGLIQDIEFNYEQFNPLYDFEYKIDPDNPESPLGTNYQVTNVKLTTHWGRDEHFLQNGNERISLGARRAPIFELAYTYGFKGVLESDFDYHKLEFEMDYRMRVGVLGISRYKLNAGYIFGQLPYPHLENHVGNESFFYTSAAFNTMNFSEFVSDQYVSLRYYHSFNGLILNKIPLIRKLKWRLLGTANVIYGDMREENINIIPETNADGEVIRRFNTLQNSPFVEVGYGVENVFKFFRFDFVHRLTYLDLPNVEPFRFKVSMQFIL